jgi:fatty acid desaturase
MFMVSEPTLNLRGHATTPKELSVRIFHKWLLPALSDWVIIVCLFALGFVINHFLLWAIITVLIGNRQHALGVLGHDGAHFTAAKSKKVNDWASELLCFWPLITGLEDFRQFHFKHHRYFRTEKDPELLFKDHWSARQWDLPSSRLRILTYFSLDLVGFGIVEVLKAYYLMGKVRFRSWYGPVLWWAVVGGSLYASGFGFAIIIWFIALGTSFWGFFRLRTWTEHVGTDSTHRVHANWWQRIIVTPHGSWSHYEHHANPSVPFWRRHELRGKKAATVRMGQLFSSFSRARNYSEPRTNMDSHQLDR